MRINNLKFHGLAATRDVLIEMARLSPTDALATLSSSAEGLDEKEAARRLHIYGLNDVICEAGSAKTWQYFERLRNNLVLPVLTVAVVLLFIGKTGAGGIIAAFLASTLFWSWGRSRSSTKMHKKLWSEIGLTAKVRRKNSEEGRWSGVAVQQEFRKIPLRELVPGDIVALETGDRVPADVRLLKVKDLVVNQTLLSCAEGMITKSTIEPFELEGICLMGSQVVSGSAEAVVVLTGVRTWFGATKAWRRLRMSGH